MDTSSPFFIALIQAGYPVKHITGGHLLQGDIYTQNIEIVILSETNMILL